MRKIFMTMIVFMFAIVIAGCGKNAAEENGKESEKSDNESETTEISGTLSFYTSQPDADAQALVEAFQKKNPNVKVETFRSGTEEVISKIQAEKQAGDIQADVLLVADSVTFESLKEDDLLLSYQSPETKQIPASFVDQDGTYTGTKVMATALVINTNEVKELPDGWSVLTEKESKGKASMPSPFYSGAAAYNLGVITRQDSLGWDFYKDLKANEIGITKGNGGVLEAVATGEKSYGIVVDFVVARAKKEGSPVELIYPKEGVPVITEPVGIMKNTKNEAAAKAFIDFVLSEEGQKLAAELGYTPIREGIAAPEGLKTLDEMNVLEANITELYKAREEDKKQFGNIFGQ
ncbi:ABC transporter substrate-binding protein [Bacillus aquiflavi]|uniref:ABC transporter substrate-binding protein n=1 Tax=Bacillus aquiflavi TaxID=2672567 RepID=A0A6B3VT30_9BACI|nr:ABC transporter substrate-binding protein [Bacillus aquiflavi]MBA4536772.1 ABC transporter substrate-binding protein [Bacillus aquiflavi]NEY81139.1 ABC transporter substrate-binding protein [Bacillus aquiflavi]UAC49701.1 ABC transporter substrate-binding protein [Bacillus aquiflavi]